MNLFLLVSVPLAVFAVHRWTDPDRLVFADPKSWILGLVWSFAALVATSFFGRIREFTGDLLGVFAGLTFTDVILLPGILIAAWVVTRRRREVWELGLWLALLFTLTGIRDFLWTRNTFDLTELFLVPLDRVLLVLVVPSLTAKALGVQVPTERGIWIAAGSLVLLTGALVPTLSFAGWGWFLWIALPLAIAAAVLVKKKAAPWRGGPWFDWRSIWAGRPKRP